MIRWKIVRLSVRPMYVLTEYEGTLIGKTYEDFEEEQVARKKCAYLNANDSYTFLYEVRKPTKQECLEHRKKLKKQ